MKLIFDTETANTIEDALFYDFGCAIMDEDGNIIEGTERSFVNADIFLDKELMETAYFAEKIPTYWDEIKQGKRQLRRFYNIRREVIALMKEFGVREVVAHNVRFDYNSTNTTQRLQTGSRYRYFFPYGTKYVDTLKMSREVFGEDEEYTTFCVENGYTTTNGKPRFTAEVLFRFLSGDNEFVEEHTGLADVKIESQIFKACRERKPSVEGYLW